VTWTPDAPRYRLLEGPSPLHRLPGFAAALGSRSQLDLWIKREDLLPLAFGGNKLRNLEFLVGAAMADGADTLVTSGRRWSNHCRLTAAAGARAGLEVHLVLTGPPARTPGANERLERLMGARVQLTATDDRAERVAAV
jgi:L-cysteate sulfo-lyase